MKKSITLPLLAVIAGIGGFALRRWQLATAYNPSTELFQPNAPATMALIAFTAAVVLLFLTLLRRETAPSDYPSAFSTGHSLPLTLGVSGAILLLASFFLCVRGSLSLIEAWDASPMHNALPVPLMITAVMCIPAALATLALAKMNYRGGHNRYHGILAALPAYASLPWLITLYQENSRQPDTLDYVFTILAAICTVMALYRACAFAYGRARPRMCLFLSLMAVFFNLTSLADGPTFHAVMITLSFTLILLSNSISLLDTTEIIQEVVPSDDNQ